MDELFMAIEANGARPDAWERWATKVEKLIGHSLDGDQDTDGYSMDKAYAYYSEGDTTPQEMADFISKSKAKLSNRAA